MFSGRPGSPPSRTSRPRHGRPGLPASRRSASTNGPSSGSAYGARSEPGSPKSRANASGSTTRSVPARAGRDLVERGEVLSRVEARGALDEPHSELGHASRLSSACPSATPQPGGVGARLPACRTDGRSWAGSSSPGGAAVRFQGADKASIEIGGVTLLEHVLGRARRGARRGRRRRGARHQPPGHLPARGPTGGWACRGPAGRARRASRGRRAWSWCSRSTCHWSRRRPCAG